MTEKFNSSHVFSEILTELEQFMILMNAYLAHFPKHEKFALVSRIKENMIDVYEAAVESKKRRQNKTALTKLDVEHELLRRLVTLSYRLGYLDFPSKKKNDSGMTISEKRYCEMSDRLNKIGKKIGFWLRGEGVF